MNLCSDQLVLMMADPGQILSVSHVAGDPLTSVMADAADGIRRNRGRAEEIYMLDPDVVFASEFSDPVAIDLLKTLEIDVVTFPAVTELGAIAPQVRAAGAVLGQGARAEALAAEVETRLAATAPSGEGPVAAFFFANGYSLGAGTLSHDILTRAGFRNLAEVLGRPPGGRLSLEDLLLNRPELIIVSSLYPGASEAEAIMDHPALSDIPRIETTADWVCGTPKALDALDRMVRIRETLAAEVRPETGLRP